MIADDTDVFVLFMYHWGYQLGDIFFRMETKKRGGVSKIWKIRDVADFHGPIICNILFIHAWSGCDTTSSIQGKGKGNIIQKLKKSESAPELANTFLKENSTHEEIEDAGIKLFLLNYHQEYTNYS